MKVDPDQGDPYFGTFHAVCLKRTRSHRGAVSLWPGRPLERAALSVPRGMVGGLGTGAPARERPGKGTNDDPGESAPHSNPASGGRLADRGARPTGVVQEPPARLPRHRRDRRPSRPAARGAPAGHPPRGGGAPAPRPAQPPPHHTRSPGSAVCACLPDGRRGAGSSLHRSAMARQSRALPLRQVGTAQRHHARPMTGNSRRRTTREREP